MTKLELLNVFLNDRLTAAAQEIFRAVKDTVVEYQREILRSKEENERLKRLLNVAVQRLLLQPETQSVHPQEEEQSCELEWRSRSELQMQVKQEPNFRDVQINCSHDDGDTTEEEPPQRPVQTACTRGSASPARTSQEVKTDTDEESFPLAGCLSSPLHAGSDRGTHGDPGGQTPKAELSGCVGQKAFLCSNSKQSVPSAQLKNVRSLKPPPPRPSHPNQSKQRWHSCKECGKSFSFACQLEVHMRWHTKEKPYSCAVCRKSFTTVSMLKRHHRIHTGEKPFRCHVCGKCFNQSAHLNTHFRLHTRERASWSRVPHPRNPQAT